MTASETLANSRDFWMTASRFFTIELAFCERDENHKFDGFKTKLTRISFLMKSCSAGFSGTTFYFL